MRVWRHLLGGLILWTAHFFGVYAIASILPGTAAAPFLVVMVTVLAMGIAWWLATKTFAALRSATDDLHRWSAGVALIGYALAGTAILYQGLPAVLR